MDLEERLELWLQLAALGRRDEAVAALRAIGTTWDRARALGTLVGSALGRGEPWSLASQLLAALSPDVAEALVALLAREPDREVRSDALDALLAITATSLAPARRHALIAAHAVGRAAARLRLSLAKELAAAAPAQAAHLIREVLALDAADQHRDDALAAALALRGAFEAPEVVAVVVRWLAIAGRPAADLLAACTCSPFEEQLPAALLALAGPAGVVAIATALDEVTTLLGELS